MVVSKRCKICTVIDPNNMPISGEYFGKLLPEIIEKVSGIELDPRKLIDVLICQQCAISLVLAESVVSTLRKNMLRLTKPQSASTKTTKTPSKVVKAKNTTTPRKKKETLKDDLPTKTNGEVGFKKFADTDETLDVDVGTWNSDESTPGKKKKNVKRKLEESRGEGDAADNDNAVTPKMESAPRTVKRQKELSSDGAYDSFTELMGNEKKRTKTNSVSSNEMNLTAKEADENTTSGEQCSKLDKTKEMNCVLCGKKFNHKTILREHIETSHMGEKLKECPNCSMEFRSSQKYDSHVFGEKCKDTLHPCRFDNCHRRFKNVLKMESHMREKHLSLNGVDTE